MKRHYALSNEGTEVVYIFLGFSFGNN